MKRTLTLFLLVISLLVLSVGCTTTKSFTYDVETGDKIKIELDTTDGYNITSKLPFTISKDDNTLSQGTFISIDSYNQYLDVVLSDKDSKIIDSGTKNGISYTFYSFKDSEFNYIIKVNNSNTAILLGNPNSQKEAETIFDLLTFSVE